MKLFQMKNKTQDLIGFLIVAFHLVGMVGLSTESYFSIFISLVPYNLLITFLLCCFYISFQNYYKPMVLIAMIGFVIEVVGVKTGVLFGEYHYGSVLGFKVLGVPLVIGLNWLVLSLATHSIMRVFLNNRFSIICTASLLMVLLDLLIEPVAIKLGFWTWDSSFVPLQNYIMWFFSAFVMQYVLIKFNSSINYKLGLYVISSQLIFFIYLVFNL
ncbi:MAG: hypothetical protein CMD26_06360 [Flavobacteriales bacterium]|nr:hypothetical protein [Flavobacteriales bacterium]|tara:strand:+ start:1630 stop:2271 length:642 start_codon:yes stop_codon:yes gene_type:complete